MGGRWERSSEKREPQHRAPEARNIEPSARLFLELFRKRETAVHWMNVFSCISIVIAVCGFGLSVQNEPVEAQLGWSPSPRAAQLMEFEKLISDPRWQWDPDEARAVAYCESWLKPHVVRRNSNGTFDHGYFQINSVWEPARPELFSVIDEWQSLDDGGQLHWHPPRLSARPAM